MERARGEAEESHGQMQATCYAIRFAGNVVGCLGGALLYNRAAWGWGLTFRQVSRTPGIFDRSAICFETGDGDECPATRIALVGGESVGCEPLFLVGGISVVFPFFSFCVRR